MWPISWSTVDLYQGNLILCCTTLIISSTFSSPGFQKLASPKVKAGKPFLGQLNSGQLSISPNVLQNRPEWCRNTYNVVYLPAMLKPYLDLLNTPNHHWMSCKGWDSFGKPVSLASFWILNQLTGYYLRHYASIIYPTSKCNHLYWLL